MDLASQGARRESACIDKTVLLHFTKIPVGVDTGTPEKVPRRVIDSVVDVTSDSAHYRQCIMKERPASARYGDFATVDQIPRSAGCYPASVMEAKGLTPILNVSDIASTVAWFEKWGWKKLWDWGTPPTFGAVGSGKETCIFLCQGAQGGRGRGANTTTFQQDGDEEGDKGVWMSVWVDDVDEMHKQCVAAGLEITFPPTDMPWNVREMHLRHPDGHVFRVGRGFEPKK
jgi:hypothetical protein